MIESTTSQQPLLPTGPPNFKVVKAYWVDGKSTPEEVRKARSLWIDTQRGDGCFLVHGEEWFEEGTEVSGLPLISRFGEICVVSTGDNE